jgi:hypothetical protein
VGSARPRPTILKKAVKTFYGRKVAVALDYHYALPIAFVIQGRILLRVNALFFESVVYHRVICLSTCARFEFEP